MLRTASHSACEASREDCATLDSLYSSAPAGPSKKGTSLLYPISPPFSLSLSASLPPALPYVFSVPPASFYLRFKFFTLILCIPMLWQDPHHSPSTPKFCSFLVCFHPLRCLKLACTPGRLRPGLPSTGPHLGHRGEQ